MTITGSPGGVISRKEFRLVTLCGSNDHKTDAIRGVQDALEQKLIGSGITVLPVDLGRWSMSSVLDILREIRRQRPDVILMQYPTAAFGASLGPAAIGALQRVAPLVVMLHEFVAAHPLRKLAVGVLVARATLIATTAEREASLLIRWFPWLRGRIRDIPVAPTIPGRAWTPTLPVKVVYFGQIRPEKGLEEFLACQRRVAAELPHVEFHIIGAIVPKFDAFASSILKSAHDLGVIVRLGLESNAVADALAAATIALLPFPDGASFRRTSMLAAAACGVPIITTVGKDTPSELTSYLEPADGNGDLGALIGRYLSDRQSLLRAHEQSVKISRRSNWDASVDGYVTVLNEAIAYSRRSRERGFTVDH